MPLHEITCAWHEKGSKWETNLLFQKKKSKVDIQAPDVFLLIQLSKAI